MMAYLPTVTPHITGNLVTLQYYSLGKWYQLGSHTSAESATGKYSFTFRFVAPGKMLWRTVSTGVPLRYFYGYSNDVTMTVT